MRAFAASLTVAMAALLTAGTATAAPGDGPVTSIKVTPVSAGASVFESAEHHCQSEKSAAWGYRQEPAVAVNPTDPQNLVAIWRQDQWGGGEGEGGGALSNVVAYSTNGGVTWTEVLLPWLTHCTSYNLPPEPGEEWPIGASDPTVSFGPDGTAYVGALQFKSGAEIAIGVYRSTDGGRSWNGPYTAQEPDGFNDKAAIIADPHTSGRVYLVWIRDQTTEVPCVCLPLVMARSDDYGQTWSKPVPVDRPMDGFANTAAQLSVLPDGDLVALFAELPGPAAFRTPGGTYPASIYAARSDDGGETWSRHKVADYTLSRPSGHDPDTDRTIDAAEFFIEQAAGHDGTLYAVWHHNTSTSLGEVFAARSDNGGKTWTDPLTVATVPAQVLDPTIAVADDGTVAVTWADLRNDDGRDDAEGDADGELTTDWWIAASRDRGETWTENHLSGPFDLRNAQFVRGTEERDRAEHYWLGDYYGIAPMPGGFGAVFVEAREPRVFGGPEEWISQTDVLFGRIRLEGPHK